VLRASLQAPSNEQTSQRPASKTGIDWPSHLQKAKRKGTDGEMLVGMLIGSEPQLVIE